MTARQICEKNMLDSNPTSKMKIAKHYMYGTMHIGLTKLSNSWYLPVQIL